MKKNVTITYKGKDVREVPFGTTLKELSKLYQEKLDYEIIIAKIDNDLAELGNTITRRCNIEFFDRSTNLGRCVYSASATFILVVAVKHVLGNQAHVIIHHSLDNGVYCHIEGADITEQILKEIEVEMHNVVKQDILFRKFSCLRTDAIKYCKSRQKDDRVAALKYVSSSYVSLYGLEDEFDYYYSKLAYSTGQINDFKLTFIGTPNGNDFILSIPSLIEPSTTKDYVHNGKILEAFKTVENVMASWNIKHASDVNQIASNGDIGELIINSEAYYDTQLQNIVKKILADKNIRIVLLAGPSSSGKTTTSKKLMSYLKCYSKGVIQISVDNYFVNKVDTPKDQYGKYDFESLYAVDLDLFNRDLQALLNGQEVELPVYNFIKGEREYRGDRVKLKENDIMVIEGIHALNDKLTSSIDNKNKYHIYISPLISINIDNHNHIHTSDIRKLRRLVRDNRMRGHNALSTLGMWESIRSGEERNIYPYQHRADAVINSSLVYEIGVLKTYVEPLLFSVNEDDEIYPEALHLINFLRNFVAIPGDSVPIDSVLREFIGGSCFKD